MGSYHGVYRETRNRALEGGHATTHGHYGDNVSIGPREIDLIPTWHASIRYGRDQAWVNAFIEQYGYDLTDWAGLDALVRMRDLVQLSGPLSRALDAPKDLAAFRQRFDAIRAGDRTSVWIMH